MSFALLDILLANSCHLLQLAACLRSFCVCTIFTRARANANLAANNSKLLLAKLNLAADFRHDQLVSVRSLVHPLALYLYSADIISRPRLAAVGA